ncbi:MAG: hypothetical protein IJT59_03785 [Desulfovibrionaceae bacterium]|nr:hypothetical protein [Desulfovibrionaceae bacterium]
MPLDTIASLCLPAAFNGEKVEGISHGLLSIFLSSQIPGNSHLEPIQGLTGVFWDTFLLRAKNALC